MDEDQLLQRSREFDLQALAEIYDTYSSRLYAYALRLLGEAFLAEGELLIQARLQFRNGK
jgi:DNA-directed RNA polymerase specialized sigma24 family protein